MIIYLPVVFPCNYIVDTYGLRVGVLSTKILIGATLTTLGSWVRVGAYNNFWCILLGYTLAGIGQPFLLNSPGKLAATWFRPEMVRDTQRTIATTIGAMANVIGMSIGFVFPAVLVHSSSRRQIFNLMLVEAILCSAVFLAVLLGFSEKPGVLPSKSAGQPREAFRPALKAVFRNKAYLLLLLAFSMVSAAQYLVATLISIISEPYGFSSLDSSIFGGLFFVVGLVGAGVFGTIVASVKKYKLICIIECVGALGSLLFFVFTLPLRLMAVSCIAVGMLGFMLNPIIPISYELAIEITYPIGEAMTGGILNCGGQVLGIVGIGLSYGLQNQSMIICGICAAGLGIGAISLWFTKEELQRNTIDTRAKDFISLHETA